MDDVWSRIRQLQQTLGLPSPPPPARLPPATRDLYARAILARTRGGPEPEGLTDEDRAEIDSYLVAFKDLAGVKLGLPGGAGEGR